MRDQIEERIDEIRCKWHLGDMDVVRTKLNQLSFFIFCLFVFLLGLGGTKSQRVIEQTEKKLKHENKYASEYASKYPHCYT